MSQVPILSGIPAATGEGLSAGPGGLIFGLIRVRSSMFIGIQIDAAMQVTNVSVIPRIIIPSPENRKVVGSLAARISNWAGFSAATAANSL